MFQEHYRLEASGLAVGRVERDENFTALLGFYHNEYQIQYVLSGERFFFFEGVCYHMSAGTMALIDKSLIPKTCLIGGSFHDRLLLEMKQDTFQALFEELGLNLADFFQSHHGVYHVPPESFAAGVFARIDALARKEQPNREALLKLEVLHLLVHSPLWEKDKIDSVNVLPSSAQKQKKVHEVADYIAAHFKEDCSVDHLSQRFFMSKSYLCRTFREVTNFTITEYVNLYRIAASKDYLLNETYSIGEIASLLGYDSLTYFERVFKKRMSVTPLQFRKQHRKG